MFCTSGRFLLKALAYEDKLGKCYLHYPIHLCHHLQGTISLHPKPSLNVGIPRFLAIYCTCLPVFDHPKWMTSHLSTLSSICDCSAQLFSWSMSLCIFRQPFSWLLMTAIFMSSVNLLMTPSKTSNYAFVISIHSCLDSWLLPSLNVMQV